MKYQSTLAFAGALEITLMTKGRETGQASEDLIDGLLADEGFCLFGLSAIGATGVRPSYLSTHGSNSVKVMKT